MRSRIRLAVLLVAIPITLSGCIELQRWLTGVVGDNGGNGGGASDNDNMPTPDPGNGETLAVDLRASNTSPVVGEEVVFTCSLRAGDGAGIEFDFQPRIPRLVVDESRGRATFIVSPSDVGVELGLRCSATNAGAESATSAEVVVIPVSASP